MKGKKLWWAVGAILFVIVAALAFAVYNKGGMSGYSQYGNDAEAGSQNQVTGGGNFVEYSEQSFAEAEGERWLFFHADWCPQCRALEQSITQSGAPDGVTIFKVDYDSAADLKKKYGVTLQTTVVAVDENGGEVKKLVAYNEPTIEAVTGALKD